MFNTHNFCYNCFNENRDTAGACLYCGYDDIENREKYPTALKAGSILNGQYIVGRVLGQGGFGITYLALDYRLKIKVAIKEYIPDGMATRLPDTTLVSVYAGEKQDNFNYGAERFLDEARVLAKFIGNKNIAGVKSYFSENNTAYFVMDYIEGISFKNYIKNNGGRIAYTDALRVLVPVMDALAAVHREGFIHRDVTPDNIYITKDNEIKLLDFGSARYSLGDKSKSLDVILKAGYAPKEQYIKRGKQGPYTDIYSLAACFYASITGYLPPEALERMEEDELVPISARGIRIPDSLENAIMKGLEVRAEDRWQSVEEFKAEIEGAEVSGIPPVVTDASSFTASVSPVAISVPPVTAGIPPVTINKFPNITNTGTETNTGTSEHNLMRQTTGNKERSFFKKNGVVVMISVTACVLLVILIIVVIRNRGGNISTDGKGIVTASNSEESDKVPRITIDISSDRDKEAADKAAADKEAADKEAADKAAADKEAADRAAADKEAADRAAADKEAVDRAAADKEAADKAAADKAAVDKAAAEAAKCRYCKGTGKVECTWCNGTGICKIDHQDDDGDYIYKGNPCPKTVKCDWCDGTGKK